MCSRTARVFLVVFVGFTFTLFAAAADKSKSAANASQPSYELPQPQHETLDLAMYQQIRSEGLGHSHVMEYASALDDDIATAPDRLDQPATRQCVDARSVHRDGLQ